MGLKNWIATTIAHIKKDPSAEDSNESTPAMTVVIDKTGLMSEVTDGGTKKAIISQKSPPQARDETIKPDTSSGQLEISISRSVKVPVDPDDTVVVNDHAGGTRTNVTGTNTSDAPMDLSHQTAPVFHQQNPAPAVKDVSQILQQASVKLTAVPGGRTDNTSTNRVDSAIVHGTDIISSNPEIKKKRPKGLKLKRTIRGDIMLIYKWRNWMVIPRILGTLIYFYIPVFIAEFRTGAYMAVFTLCGIGAGVFAARLYLNETMIMVVENVLSVEIYPVSFTFARTYAVADLAGISVRAADPKKPKEKPVHAIDLHMKDGATKTLCVLRTAEQADYVEHVLARAIKAADIVEMDKSAA